jgi:hypothetical protein
MVGPKHELQAANAYSVSFHDIYHPLVYMARLHSILYPENVSIRRHLLDVLYDMNKVTVELFD